MWPVERKLRCVLVLTVGPIFIFLSLSLRTLMFLFLYDWFQVQISIVFWPTAFKLPQIVIDDFLNSPTLGFTFQTVWYLSCLNLFELLNCGWRIPVNNLTMSIKRFRNPIKVLLLRLKDQHNFTVSDIGNILWLGVYISFPYKLLIRLSRIEDSPSFSSASKGSFKSPISYYQSCPRAF